MYSQSTKELVETLAEDLVLIDVENLPELAALHTKFQQLADCPEASNCEPLLRAAAQCANLIEQIILREVEDAIAQIQKINDVVAAIQLLVRDERSAADVHIPDLGVPAHFAPPDTLNKESEADSPDEVPAPLTKPISLPANVDPSIFENFLTHQALALEDMELAILDLEKPNGPAARQELLRLLHTLKGEASMMGLEEIETLCHRTEEALGRSGDMPLTDVLLSVKDWVHKSLEFYGGKLASPPDGFDALLSQLDTVTQAESDGARPPMKAPQGADERSLLEDFITESREHLEAVDVHLLTIDSAPDDQEALSAIFRAFHTIKGVAGFLELGNVLELAHEAENLLDLVRKQTITMAGEAVDVTFAAADTLERYLSQWSQYLTDGTVPSWEPAHDQLLARIRRVASGEAAVSTSDGPATVSAVSTDVEATAGSIRQFGERKEIVKVDAKRLDRIVDAIGELVIAVSMVRQSVNASGETADLSRQMGHLEKITRELQEMGTSLRMVPIRPVFQKMARLARDLAKKVGKRVDFIMSGEDTELDKTVVDQISDPLVHMIRNAIDHGLEDDAEARIRARKAEVGTVQLRAFHQGGNIIVEVSDDGRGLNREAILRKAKERGVVSDSDQLSDKEITDLIFHPGLSTAKVVTDVSGRGVGMDVVRKNIEALRGQVSVDSEPGKGCTFTIVLPLTLAIIDGMSVRVGKERYIIPTLSIVASIRPDASALTTVFGRGEMLTFQKELVPLIRLYRLFAVRDAEKDPLKGLVVLVENQGQKTGLLVDELLGQQQIVIKTLGESMRGLPGIAGGAIMPDGNVGLILDVAGLVQINKNHDFKDCA